jgi:hypothetical protein
MNSAVMMIVTIMNKWRSQSDPPTPGFNLREPRAKTKAPHDPTYGREPDMLDKPGLIVEPDVRRKIAKYFKKMKMREMIEEILDEMGIS